MDFYKITALGTRSRLCRLLIKMEESLCDGTGFAAPISAAYSQGQLDKMSEDERFAVAMREDIAYYELFKEFDIMYRYLTERKAVKMTNVPYPEIPYEFIRTMVNVSYKGWERKKINDKRIHEIYDSMGDSAFFYFQGLLYEYYCDTRNAESKKRLSDAVHLLVEADGNCQLGNNEELDAYIGRKLHGAIEKVQASEKYAELMESLIKGSRETPVGPVRNSVSDKAE